MVMRRVAVASVLAGLLSLCFSGIASAARFSVETKNGLPSSAKCQKYADERRDAWMAKNPGKSYDWECKNNNDGTFRFTLYYVS